MTDTQNPVAETVDETTAVDTTQGDQTFESLVGEEPAKTPIEVEKDARDSLIIELKQERREDRKVMKEMKTAIETLVAAQKSGNKGDIQEAKDELDLLAEEYDVDPTFVKKLAKTLSSNLEGKISSKADETATINHKLENEQRNAKLESDLNSQFETALKMDPRYENIAKKDVVLKYIKSTVLTNKEEMKKTMVDVLEDLYGHIIQDSGIERPAGKGSSYDEPINYSKPSEKDFQKIQKEMAKTGQVPADYIDNLFARAGVQIRKNKN